MWRRAIPALSNTPDSRSNKALAAAERFARQVLRVVLLDDMRRNRGRERE